MEMGCGLPRNQKVNLVIYATVKSPKAWNRWITYERSYGLYMIMPLPIFLILTHVLFKKTISSTAIWFSDGMGYSWSAFPMRVGRVLLGGP